MKGDFSRFTHDPDKHYTGVLKQQGRVDRDADWNEYVEIQDHLRHTTGRDVIGPCGVPETKDGFRVDVTTASDGQKLTLSLGRIYVDGILCEQEEQILYDLSNLYPFVPQQAQTDLVYLDVWQHHVTVIEDPDMREEALGGADTTTRIQTVWRPKVLTNVGNVSCDDKISKWPPLAHSEGKLTASVSAGTKPEDPCLLGSEGGYKGLENRLYRVEIHQEGDSGTATFKWSRDNGAVVFAIEEFLSDKKKIKLSHLGRDQVLTLHKGDWVEILDDEAELSQYAGTLAKIDEEPDHVTRTITLDRQVTGYNATKQHARVRRWDQASDAIKVELSKKIKLEHGILVEFSGKDFKAGDYWVFAARTATGEIDKLKDASPHGIKHHYCKLALITWKQQSSGQPVAEKKEDCRKKFPPLTAIKPAAGCCTLFVQPGEDIQKALDSLPSEGGCVCLKTGVHTITRSVRITRSNVALRGESPGTRVQATNLVNLLDVSGSNIVVEDIRFEALGDPSSAVYILELQPQCRDIRIRKCHIIGIGDKLVSCTGVAIWNAADVTVADNHIQKVFIGVLSNNVGYLHVSRNRIEGLTKAIPDSDMTISWGYYGIQILEVGKGHCHIQDNLVKNFESGISLWDLPNHSTSASNQTKHSTIVANQILRPVFTAFPQGEIACSIGIEAETNHCAIQDNYMELGAPFCVGIRVAGDHNRIANNTLISSIQKDSGQLPIGIFASKVSGVDPFFYERETSHTIIHDNILNGIQNPAIMVYRASAIKVSSNRIKGREQQGSAIAVCEGTDVVVADNHIEKVKIAAELATDRLEPATGRGNRVLRNYIGTCEWGILAHKENTLEIFGNVIESVQNAGIAGLKLEESIRITHNRLSNCGYGGFAIGILVQSRDDLYLAACEVCDTGIEGPKSPINSKPLWGIIALVHSCHIVDNRVTYTDVKPLAIDKEHRALLLDQTSLSGNKSTRLALVLNNVFAGPGMSHLVEFGDSAESYPFERVTFSNNFCDHTSHTTDDELSTVILRGKHMIVMGNHIKAQFKAQSNTIIRSMDLTNSETVTLMSNIATGKYIYSPSKVVPLSYTDFNVTLK